MSENVDEDVGASKPQQVRVTGFTSPAYMDLTSCLLADTRRHGRTSKAGPAAQREASSCTAEVRTSEMTPQAAQNPWVGPMGAGAPDTARAFIKGKEIK